MSQLDKSYQSSLGQFDQMAAQQSQEAYILNQRMAKYLGNQNTAMGVNGLTASDQIGLQNNYVSQLGQINQQRDINKSNAFSNMQNSKLAMDTQHMQNLYQTGLIDKQNQQQQSLIDMEKQQAYQDQVYSIIYNKVYSEMQKAIKGTKNMSASQKNSIVQNILNQYVNKYKTQIGDENYELLKLYLQNYS